MYAPGESAVPQRTPSSHSAPSPPLERLELELAEVVARLACAEPRRAPDWGRYTEVRALAYYLGRCRQHVASTAAASAVVSNTAVVGTAAASAVVSTTAVVGTAAVRGAAAIVRCGGDALEVARSAAQRRACNGRVVRGDPVDGLLTRACPVPVRARLE